VRHSRAASRPTRRDSTEIWMTTARPPCRHWKADRYRFHEIDRRRALIGSGNSRRPHRDPKHRPRGGRTAVRAHAVAIAPRPPLALRRLLPVLSFRHFPAQIPQTFLTLAQARPVRVVGLCPGTARRYREILRCSRRTRELEMKREQNIRKMCRTRTVTPDRLRRLFKSGSEKPVHADSRRVAESGAWCNDLDGRCHTGELR
jgi:hypothetical protein